ncbi:MAG: ATP-dependent Clp protease ATP-binding subunit [bacterium]|nr:ATP-dependent Clp protease ATP-binding subunit [bacterium]
MVNFYLRKSPVFQAAQLSKWFCFKYAKFFKKIFFIAFLPLFLAFLFGFFTNEFSITALAHLLGASLLLMSLAVIFWQLDLFFNLKVGRPEPKASLKEVISDIENFNLADFIELEAALMFKRADNICQIKKISFHTTVLFYSLLSENPPLTSFVFSRLLLSQTEIQRSLEEKIKQIHAGENQNPVDFFIEALNNADKRDNKLISCGNVLTALSKYDPHFRELLIESDLRSEDIDNLTWWWETNQKKMAERKKFWEYKNLIKMGSVGKEWSAGYTVTLDRHSTDLTEVVKDQGFAEIVGHQKEIEQIERSLARSEFSNVLLVGEAGSGRGAIIQALTQKLLFGESLPELNYKRVVELDLPSLISSCQGQEGVAQLLERIFQEILMAKNIVLVIQDFHNFLGGGKTQGPGKIDISGVIARYLQIPSFKFIAVTNFPEFHKTVDTSQVGQFFEKVEISQISQEETIMLLELFVPYWEAKYKKFISYPALRELVTKADRYLPALPFPKKATDLMAETIISIAQTKEPILLPKHVAKLISEKTDIPVGQLSIKEKQVLLDLESLIHQRIINQEEAVKEVSAALRRARSDITVRKGPMGTFLFLGPTGVGKTETAKALAAIYFGSEERIIRLDLSEYQNVQDSKRLIGSTEEQSFFVNQVRETPFALILLDEIEKGHPNILNLFLRILDEGFMTDGLGRKISFLNTVIIATSNAGYQVILEALAKDLAMPQIKEKLLSHVFEQGLFRPEFINRFDAVVVFKSLTKENLLAIAGLLMQKLKKNLMEKGIELVITDALKEKIVELGYDPVFGARQMRRVIQDKVENILASALLSGQLKRGSRIEITVPDFKLNLL